MPADLEELHCLSDGCGALLGRTDGLAFYLTSCMFKRPVTLHCNACGAWLTWRPLNDRRNTMQRSRVPFNPPAPTPAPTPALSPEREAALLAHTATGRAILADRAPTTTVGLSAGRRHELLAGTRFGSRLIAEEARAARSRR